VTTPIASSLVVAERERWTSRVPSVSSRRVTTASRDVSRRVSVAKCVHRDTDRDRSRDAIDITMKKNSITHHIERDVVDHFWLTSPP
jgi:hypothetical protein